MILECLEDNFKTFLDKSYYVYRSNKVCGHIKYNDRMFNHRNPMTNLSDYEYYIRCVDRFNRLLSSGHHKLFIMMFVNMNWIKVKEIIEFNDKFQKYTHNYTLLIIFHKKGKRQRHKFVYYDNIHFLILKTISKSDGVSFDISDNLYLDNIIKTQYKLNI